MCGLILPAVSDTSVFQYFGSVNTSIAVFQYLIPQSSRDGHNRYSTLSFVALKARGHENQKESLHVKSDFTEWYKPSGASTVRWYNSIALQV